MLDPEIQRMFHKRLDEFEDILPRATRRNLYYEAFGIIRCPNDAVYVSLLAIRIARAFDQIDVIIHL